MLAWFAFLILLPIGGDLLMQVLALPLPGSVVGFLALLAWLCRRGSGTTASPPAALADASGELVRRLPVFLVPSSVGLLAHLDLLGTQWAAMLAAIVVGTAATIAITGLIAGACLRAAERAELRQAARPNGAAVFRPTMASFAWEASR